MHRIRSKLSFANVVSCLALFVALGGGAAYAAEMLPRESVGTEQLKGYAVTGAKLANSSIGSTKLAANSVAGTAIQNGAVTNSKLPTAAVTNPKIAAGAVTSASVADHSLTTSDLATRPVVASGFTGTFAYARLSEECTHYEEAEVTITVPSSGSVLVDAVFTLESNHMAGRTDEILVSLSELPTTCAIGNGQGIFEKVPEGEPTFLERIATQTATQTFQVSAGTHTFYLNAYKRGPDEDHFEGAGLTALFIPR